MDHQMNNGPEPVSSEPILELRELEEVASAGFEGRVRRSILRRSMASDLAGYVWYTPFRILLEYLGLVLSFAGSRVAKGGGDA